MTSCLATLGEERLLLYPLRFGDWNLWIKLTKDRLTEEKTYKLYLTLIFLRGIGDFTERNECTTMFILALFTIARTWKQPKCPLTDEWIKKMWHIYSMEYYSAIKRNEIELFVVRWMDLESVIQSEVSWKEKHKYCMLTHIYGI